MRTIFKQLLFKRDQEWNDNIRESKIGFYIAGVNSGVYNPATLVVEANIVNKTAGLFRFNTLRTHAQITLSPDEFDELFAEMEKIKKLRDSLK